MSTAALKKEHRMPSKQRREKTANILCLILLILLGLIVLFPIYWIFRSSLMSNGELYTYPPAFLPPAWRFSNYPETLKSFEYLQFLGNTMTILIPAVLGAVVTATMGGYAFARLRFRGKKFLFTLCVGSMLLPSMVTLIPLFMAWSKLGLVNTYWPLILPHFCGGGAFNIFLIRQFVKTVPRELDEAATIDGCGFFRILIFIIVPAIFCNRSLTSPAGTATPWPWASTFSGAPSTMTGAVSCAPPACPSSPVLCSI